jgi:FemAB-related protein (PEP-CTERM system-associated)
MFGMISMNFNIKLLENDEEDRWEQFVTNSDLSTYCHQIGWKHVIEDTYGHKSFYLFAESDIDGVIGILPLFLVENFFFGKRLISLPFVPFGGICCNDIDVENALIEEAISLGNSYDVDYCEIRSLYKSKSNILGKSEYYVTSLLTLEDSAETTLKNMTRNKRKTIYKSLKNNLKVLTFSDCDNVLNDFYNIYSLNMKRIGTPQHSLQFFKNILKYLPSDVICVYDNDGLCHYSALVIFFKDRMIDYTSSAFKESRNKYVTDFGVWNLILKAHELNYKYFDFGRSVIDSSNLESKRRWGATTIELNYFYPISTKLDFNKLNPSNYGQIASFWSKLPSSINNKLGPIIRSFIV